MAGIVMISMPALDKPTLELKDKDQQSEKLVSRLENLNSALLAADQPPPNLFTKADLPRCDDDYQRREFCDGICWGLSY